VRVAALYLDLGHAASRLDLAHFPAEPLDPRRVLDDLAVDPELRASAAVYHAALLHPSVAVAGFSPLTAAAGTGHARILRAIVQVDRLLASPAAAVVRAPRRPASWDRTIAAAAAAAGVDGAFLRRIAGRESQFNPYARASGTTARGMFQFVDQTWLASVSKWGARHGLGTEARLIGIDRRGRAFVADPSAEREILALRYDPTLAAPIAAELAADNASVMARDLGRAPSSGELYAAHLLGPEGAERLIHAADTWPDYPAAWLFPGAAARNPRLFFQGRLPRSVSELLLALS
jgi:hypothetical protein